MKKAEYVIINSKNNYFVRINEINKIEFTRNINEATKVSYYDSEDLISLIESYTGQVALAEPVYDVGV